MQFAGKSQLSQIIAVFVSCVVIHTMSALSLSTVCPAHHSAAPPTIPSVPSPLVSSPVVGTMHSHYGGAWRAHHSHPRSAEVANGDQL